MKLLHDDVAIKPDPPEEKTASGFYKVEDIKSYSPFGTVESVGPNISDIKVGDRVVFKQYGGDFIDKELIIVKHEAVLATL